jgi:hypothetical protein
MSKRDPIMDIISIAQHAKPNDIGQMEFFRPQLIALPMVVVMMPSGTLAASSLSMRAKSSLGRLG